MISYTLKHREADFENDIEVQRIHVMRTPPNINTCKWYMVNGHANDTNTVYSYHPLSQRLASRQSKPRGPPRLCQLLDLLG